MLIAGEEHSQSRTCFPSSWKFKEATVAGENKVRERAAGSEGQPAGRP